jgi:hypothetical protein
MRSLSIFQKIQLGIIGISLSSIIGVITTKNLFFLIAPLILEPTTLYLVSKERQKNSKELADKDSELKKALGINEDSQNQLNAEKTKLESAIRNLQNEIQTLKINYEEKIKVFNDQLLNSVPKEVISAFIDQARLLSETKENLERKLLIKSKENLAEQEQRKKMEDLISDLEAKNKSSLAMCFFIKK